MEDATSSRIFINYRRGTSAAAAGRLFDHMTKKFEQGRVFMDVDAIEPGVDFVDTLDEQLAHCSAFVAVITPGWLDLKDARGERRLDNEQDHVRAEIEAALRRKIRVVPVLIDGASMPKAKDLPPSIEAFARRNAFEVSHHRFAEDVERLAQSLQRATGIPIRSLEPAQNGTSPSANNNASAATTAAQGSSVADLWFSFRGRISRKSYWLNCVILIATLIGVMTAVVYASGESYNGGMWSQRLKLLYTIATLPFYWPTLALFMKRLHDFEQGWEIFSIVMLTTAAQIALDISGAESAAMWVALLLLVFVTAAGVVPGTRGPNKYGPDPIARPVAKPAA